MGIEDRLLTAAQSLGEAAEDPVDFYLLRNEIFAFAKLLASADKVDLRMRDVIGSAHLGLAGPVRTPFLTSYQSAAVKSAYFLLGVYETLYGYSQPGDGG